LLHSLTKDIEDINKDGCDAKAMTPTLKKQNSSSAFTMVRQKPNYSGNESPKSGNSVINSANCFLRDKGKSRFFKRKNPDSDNLSIGNNFNDGKHFCLTLCLCIDYMMNGGGVSALLKKNNTGCLDDLSSGLP
jgi:hypothetical protein